jgi:hypothetical protein
MATAGAARRDRSKGEAGRMAERDRTYWRWIRCAAAFTMAPVLGCSSHPGGGSAECASPAGTYDLTLTPTGQSENLTGTCLQAGPPIPLEISLTATTVSLNAETCVACPGDSCQVDVICGQTVACPGTVTPVADPPATYVQTVSFVLPTGVDASTGNATATVGPGACGYEGTAALVAVP